MAGAGPDAFEGDLEHQLGFHLPHGAEALHGVLLHEGVHLLHLHVREAAVGLGKGDQLAVLPQAEGVVRVQPGAAPMSLHAVREHGIDALRVHLPLPPGTAPPAHFVGAVQPLQHQAFDAVGAGMLPQVHDLLPGGEGQHLRKHEHGQVGRSDELFQPFPPPAERLPAHVPAAQFQQVVDHEGHGNIGEQLLPNGLAPDAALQLGERQGLTVLPGQDLAIEHGSLRQAFHEGLELGVLVGDQLLAAAPDVVPVPAHDHLPADAVPLVLGLPVRRVAQGKQLLQARAGSGPFRAIDAVGQVEGVGTGIVVGGRGLQDQFLEGGGVRAPVAHQAVGQDIFRDAGGLAEPLHQDLLADADAEAAGEHLIEDEERHALQPGPRGLHAAGLFLFLQSAQGFHLLNPGGKGLFHRYFQRGDVRDGLGEIAHHVVAGLEQPVGDAGHLGGPLA